MTATAPVSAPSAPRPPPAPSASPPSPATPPSQSVEGLIAASVAAGCANATAATAAAAASAVDCNSNCLSESAATRSSMDMAPRPITNGGDVLPASHGAVARVAKGSLLGSGCAAPSAVDAMRTRWGGQRAAISLLSLRNDAPDPLNTFDVVGMEEEAKFGVGGGTDDAEGDDDGGSVDNESLSRAAAASRAVGSASKT